MDAVAVVRAWFDAFERGDLDTARALFGESGVLHVADRRVAGFDAVVTWFAEKQRDEGPRFEYRLVESLPGGHDGVAAVVELRNARERWLQVAVYRIENGAIAEMWLYERAHAPSAA